MNDDDVPFVHVNQEVHVRGLVYVFIDELLLIFSLNVSLPDIFIVFSFFGHTFVSLWIASDRDSNWYRKLQFDMESRVFISQRLCIVILCD